MGTGKELQETTTETAVYRQGSAPAVMYENGLPLWEFQPDATPVVNKGGLCKHMSNRLIFKFQDTEENQHLHAKLVEAGAVCLN